METPITPDSNQKRAIGLISFDTKAIFERLMASSVGDTITYEELNEILGRDVRNGARSVLASARRMAINNGVAFGTVEKVGVKRLNDVEIVNSCESEYASIRRRSGRAMKRLTCVRNYSALPAQSKIQHDKGASFLGLLRHLAAPAQLKKLEAKVTLGQLPLQKTLEAFK